MALHKRFRRGSQIGVAVACLLTLGACGGSNAVSQSEVEKQVSEQLTAEVGQKPDKIKCPGGLEAKVDTTMRCELTAGTDTLGLTVTVTSVDGNTANFDIQVDEQ